MRRSRPYDKKYPKMDDESMDESIRLHSDFQTNSISVTDRKRKLITWIMLFLIYIAFSLTLARAFARADIQKRIDLQELQLKKLKVLIQKRVDLQESRLKKLKVSIPNENEKLFKKSKSSSKAVGLIRESGAREHGSCSTCTSRKVKYISS